MLHGNRIRRRELIRVGGLGALGLGLAHHPANNVALAGLRSSPISSIAPRAKACILVWLDGGPSHLETFDPKPDAPSEVRGPLGAISTAIPGITINEMLPELAKRMQDLALIRSMTSPLGEHNFATHYLQTGHQPTPVLEYPAFHAVGASMVKQTGHLPTSIAVPNGQVGGSRFSGHGFLNAAFGPFSVGSDPAKSNFQVKDLDLYQGISLNRLRERTELVQQLDRFSDFESKEDSGLDRAFRMLNSKEARSAFELEREPDAIRNRYGRKTIGQSCLLARRLVERGVPFVTVNNRGWDTHTDLQTRLKDGFTGAQNPVGLIPSLDLAVSALIDDLKERSLLKETLVVVMGEFGRTPKLNASGGRDHWPRVFSVALAGGGIAGGQVIGESDAVGESPASRPVSPGDLVATIYTLLGIDPSLELKTPDGRPVRATSIGSKVVAELL